MEKSTSYLDNLLIIDEWGWMPDVREWLEKHDEAAYVDGPVPWRHRSVHER